MFCILSHIISKSHHEKSVTYTQIFAASGFFIIYAYKILKHVIYFAAFYYQKIAMCNKENNIYVASGSVLNWANLVKTFQNLGSLSDLADLRLTELSGPSKLN